jgi:hypothetical protein
VARHCRKSMVCTIVLSTKLMSADLEVRLLLHTQTSLMFLCCSTIIDFKVDCKLFLSWCCVINFFVLPFFVGLILWIILMSIVLIVNNYYTMRFHPDCHCILILLHEESYIMCCPRAQQLCMYQHTCSNFNFQGMLVMLHVEKATGVVWGGCDKWKMYIGQKGPSCSHTLELNIGSLCISVW